MIRIVCGDEPINWSAYFCPDGAARVADILGTVAVRLN
jgi:hypothetical protein